MTVQCMGESFSEVIISCYKLIIKLSNEFENYLTDNEDPQYLDHNRKRLFHEKALLGAQLPVKLLCNLICHAMLACTRLA